MAIETELKLSLAPSDRRRISGLPAVRRLASGPARRRRLVSTYYDTPDLELLNRRCVLRLRRAGRTYIQAVKTAGTGSAGLHRRDEFEQKVSRPAPDFSHLKTVPLLKDLDLEGRLEPQFETDFYRTTWDLVFPDGTEVEMAVDHGEVRTGQASTEICEVEMELRSGAPDRLYEFALDAARTVDLRLEDVSKAQRGRHLKQAPRIAPVQADTVSLDRKGTTEQALIRILWDCFQQIRANESAILHTEDVEAVHQMRIGIRRLRSCINAFAAVVSKRIKPPFQAEINALAQLLGDCRDWDVFTTEHLQLVLTHLPPGHPVHDLAAAAETKRQACYGELRPFIHSRSYNRLMLQLAAFIALRAWRHGLDKEETARLERSLPKTAHIILDRNHKRIVKRAQGVKDQNVPVLHRLRIECKKQRYAVEFFASILPRKPARRYRNALRNLQDILGYLNDSVVIDALLTQLDRQPGEAHAFIAGWAARARADHLREDLPGAWASFGKLDRFWRNQK
jgi:inorganic triphosphatase YgiF